MGVCPLFFYRKGFDDVCRLRSSRKKVIILIYYYFFYLTVTVLYHSEHKQVVDARKV